MTRLRFSTKRQPRRGFTLIELLVVISIIAVLVSLIAPAVQAARRAARKLECLNNMHNVAIAMQNFASGTGGNLPYLTSNIPVTNSSGTSGYLTGAGWPITILPALDSTAVLKNIKANSSGTAGGSFAIGAGENIWLPAFTCPDDLDSFRRPGGLSFVVNSGFIPSSIYDSGEGTKLLQPYVIDWSNDGDYSNDGATITSTGTAPTWNSPQMSTDQAMEIATGVMFRATAAGTNSFTPSLDYVSGGDGTSTTLLITENLTAGPWNATGATVAQLGFSLRVPLSTGGTSTAAPNTSYFPAGSLNASAMTVVDATNNPDTWGINRVMTTAYPRPSSQHMGGVNVMYCSGSGGFISENIDKNVYAKLLTSNGVTYGEQTLNTADY